MISAIGALACSSSESETESATAGPPCTCGPARDGRRGPVIIESPIGHHYFLFLFSGRWPNL